MAVGTNYAWYGQWMGTSFGPSHEANPAQVPADMGAERKAAWLEDFDAYLERCREVGFSTVRLQLLCNAWSYGTGANETFVPPTKTGNPRLWEATQAAHEHQFRSMLGSAARRGIKLIPCLIGFDACKPFAHSSREGTPGGGGRAALITRWGNLLLDDVLEPLLAVAKEREYGGVVDLWEIFSEPIWPTRMLRSRTLAWFSAWPLSPTVSRADMASWLNRGIRRINAAGFVATTGHVFHPGFGPWWLDWSDEAALPVEARARYLPQFHWYPDGITRRVLPEFAQTQAFLGEISARPSQPGTRDPQDWAWPDLGGTDLVETYQAILRRLDRAEERGYALTCLWPSQPHYPRTNTNLEPAAERAVSDFLRQRG
jgi:hypothetical protein